MNQLQICAVFILLTSFVYSCKQKSQALEAPNPLIAKVSGYELRQSDLDQILSPNISVNDSTAIANAYVENWIRKQLWTIEAENHIETNPEITLMVDSYKSSLLKNAYESKILNEKLDTSITDDEYLSTYERYKNQFVIDSRLLKAWFAKIPKDASDQRAFYTSWKNGERELVSRYVNSNQGQYLLSENTWIKESEINDIIPSRYMHLSEIKKLTNYKKSGGDYNYYLKYTAFVDKNELAPLDYIKDELKRVIIHGRKEKIIADLTEELYEKRLQSNQIQVFTNK